MKRGKKKGDHFWIQLESIQVIYIQPNDNNSGLKVI